MPLKGSHCITKQKTAVWLDDAVCVMYMRSQQVVMMSSLQTRSGSVEMWRQR